MLIADAVTAGQLSQQIAAATAQVTLLNSGISNGAVISAGNIMVSGPVLGNVPFTVATLSVAESSTIFGAMLSVVNGRLTAWNAALAAL